MKNKAFYILTFFVLFIPILSFAQSELDSISFEDQRKKVNNLLDERSRKFGEYDISLEQKTGIFGLFKTKNDMQKSNDILKAIVINDNKIFIETRRLLALKDGEKERFQRLAKQYDSQVEAYMRTISKLQSENEKLRETIETKELEGQNNTNIIFVLSLIFIVLIFILYRLYTRFKSKNVTQV